MGCSIVTQGTGINLRRFFHMPHIAVMMYPGRDDEKKMALAKKLQDAVEEALGVDRKVISVSVEDVAKEDWDENFKKKIDKKTIFIEAEV
ncbi:tautomerase family protein [Cloacibacillus porcorum]|uniref:tautomerase family protein n=1 Tax=Cloacibacillus porcorum TaxID=1197717 RepID=UPI002A82B4F9|nr:tautomerase family protein [Cloacibacillus porcorum]MDY4092529.1 tautomerase family protein [Cloacibacillus porcorum]